MSDASNASRGQTCCGREGRFLRSGPPVPTAVVSEDVLERAEIRRKIAEPSCPVPLTKADQLGQRTPLRTSRCRECGRHARRIPSDTGQLTRRISEMSFASASTPITAIPSQTARTARTIAGLRTSACTSTV